MEKNESNSMKSIENRQSSNGRLVAALSNKSRGDERTNVELSCKKSKSCMVSPHSTTEGNSGSLGGGGSTGGNSNSHKMGSRRIFTPQFKLQVLESYRNDNDCKGNQRATARKYNIHRRQIQKWLQCESSLRSSVANINQNTVKHQFHNISIHHHQQQTHKSSIPTASMISVPPYGSNSSQHSHLVGLDATRSELPNNTLTVPSLLSSTGVTTSSTHTQGVFSAANLAAVVAAAAGAAMTITSPPSSIDTSAPPNESVASPLRRPSTIIGAKSNSPTATMSPLLHHHHHYGIPPYTIHAPASVRLPVPILTHHISHPQPIHQQAQQQHQPYQQYHNLAYTQALTPHQSDKQQSSFLSSISLPDVNALAAASLNGFSVGETEHTESLESLHSSSKTSSEHALDNTSLEQSCDNTITYHPNTPLYPFSEDGYPSMVYPLGPMDLSLRPRRNIIKPELCSTVQKTDMKHRNSESRIVDLTHRKRKVSSTSSSNNTGDHQTEELCEKQLKLKNDTDDNNYGSHTNSDEDEVEIEVGTEEKLPPSKPVKLFKPYLLDDDDDTDNSTVSSCRSAVETKYGESSDSSPWPRYATSLSPPPRCYDISGSCQGTTFQNSLKENFTTPIENSNFPPEPRADSSKSAFTSIPTISPSCFRSPKGSPSSSGYESSSSTYSDSSFSSRAESFAVSRTYNINLQMHAIHSDNIILHPSKHVERWLEQESRHPSEPNSPIAILA